MIILTKRQKEIEAQLLEIYNNSIKDPQYRKSHGIKLTENV